MLRKIFYILFATLALLVGVIAIGLQTEKVQQWVSVEFRYQVKERTGWNISYSQFSWNFPFKFTLKGILLEDLKGTKIRVERASGIVNPVALLRKYVLVHDLDIVYDEWNVTGTIRGNPDTNNFRSTLTITSIKDPHFLLLVKTKLRDLKGTLDLTGQWNGLEGHSEGDISWDGEKFHYTNVKGKVDEYGVEGQLVVDSKFNFTGTELQLAHEAGNGSFILSGPYEDLKAQFDMTLPKFKDLSAIHLKGDFFHKEGDIESQFNASFAFRDSRFFTDSNLTWSPDSPLRLRTNGRDAKGMIFDGDLNDLKEKGYALKLNVQHGTYFKELHLDATLPDKETNNWKYTLWAKGHDYSGDLEGTATLDFESQRVEVAGLSGQWQEHKLKLIDPFTVEHDPEQIKLSPLFLMVDEGTVYVTVDYIQDNIHIAARLVDLPLHLISVLKEDFPASSTFNGNFFIYGPIDHLGGQAQLDLPKIVVTKNTLATIPPLEGQINANLLNDTLELKGFFSGISNTPITLDASLPMIFSLNPLRIEFLTDRAFSTKLNYDGPVGPITELITSEIAPLKGDLALQLEMSGSFEKPKVLGSGTFRKGNYESPELGVVYSNISADFMASGDHIDITNLSATSSDTGTIKGSGVVSTNFEKRFPFDFDLILDNARLARIDWMKANGTGYIKFAGDLTHAKLSGDIDANYLKVTIPEGRSAKIKVVDVTYINQSPDEPPPTKVGEELFKWPLEFDVQIQTQKGVVSGDNFNSTWQGKIVAKGTLKDPLLEGKVRVTDGSYMFNGRPFEISQGSIAFDGHPLKSTTLFVAAEQDLGEITAEVILKGTLDNPELSLRSKPPLPQREVLSWILFGRGISEINPNENQELTKSISDLNTGGSENALTRLRSRIGIDRIDIHRDITGETNEMSIQVGKYISKGVLVSVNKSINEDANRIGIEAKLSHNFKVEAEVGDNSEGHLFLKWKKDY